MHPQFNETIEKVAAWARSDSSIAGVLIIGSQARRMLPSDRWSDLDLMLLVDDPQRLLNETGWLHQFGQVVCFFEEVVPLHFTGWAWHVRRVLYDDHRDVDFSVLPYHHVDEVLSVTKDILSKGYQVLYDRGPEVLDGKIRALLNTADRGTCLPTETELRGVVSDLLFHVIWSFKKIKRKELWVAVSCINSYMKDRLLWLIEARNASEGQSAAMAYNGRFLEQRTGVEIITALSGCFTHYDAEDAVSTLGHYIEVVWCLTKSICERNGYAFDAALFERITKTYTAMKEYEPDEHA